MCDPYMQNKVKLVSLIYSMNRFTEKELTDKYYASGNNSNYQSISIGGLHSIKSYLNDLTQFGTLRYDRGFYQVAQYGENKYG
jgi:hypothetical protein